MRKLSIICFMMCSALALVWGQATQPNAKTQAQPGMGEKNKAVTRQVFDDLFSKGRYDLIDQIYTRDCVVHTNNKNFRLEEAIEEGKGFRSAAPDLVMKVNRIADRGDRVMVDWTAIGTNTGTGNGLPATGKHLQVHGNSQFRLVNGKIAEVWNNFDKHDMLRQLGVSQEKHEDEKHEKHEHEKHN